MKTKLMIQSLSPLALLTIIYNFSFVHKEYLMENVSAFVSENKVLLLVMLVCVIWIIAAIVFYISFGSFKFADTESGYTVNVEEEKDEASLNFLMTLIIPLLIDNVNEVTGAITLLVIVVLMIILLHKTSLFYANPILSILGYRVYVFSFEENKKYTKGKYIGLCQGSIETGQSIVFKEITNNVFFIRRNK